jgi:radical SAM superfamily enzyme YgiQ (UPF0313 family)
LDGGMRILLVHPEFPVTYWGFQYSLELIGKRATLPPLGLVTLAGLLPGDWDLRLVDANIEKVHDSDLLWADAVLVGGMLVQVPSALDVIRRAKALGRVTIAGGPACTTSPEIFADADHVFLGEAEGRIESVVRAITARGESPHVLAEMPDVRPDVSTSPIPRFDLLDLAQYQTMSIQYSRGCPFTCEFCDIIEMFGRVPRTKPPAQVLAELDALAARGWRGPVFFVDDNFIGNKRAAKKLLPEVARWQIEQGYPFAFYTEASVNLAADATLLAMMHTAGFDSVFLGIESPSPESLLGTKKKQNVGIDLHEAVDAITRSGMDVMAGFIVGFDEDGPGVFEAQRRFIDASPIPLAMVGILTALPSTQLWRRLEGEGRLRHASDGDAFARPNFEPTMGDVELLEGYAGLMRDVYSPDRYYARCRAVIERVGAPAGSPPLAWRDIALALRAMMQIGVMGPRRRHFWPLVGRSLRRGTHALRRALTFAVQGEHLIRYTEEQVLPRLEVALAHERTRARDTRTARATATATPRVVRLPVVAGA